MLIRFEKEYPGVAKEDNVDAISVTLQKKADKASILEFLRQRQAESPEAKQEKKARKRDDPER